MSGREDNSIRQEEHELKPLLPEQEEVRRGTVGEDDDTRETADQTDLGQRYNGTPTVRIVEPRRAGCKNTSGGNGVEEQRAALVEVDETLQVNETEDEFLNNRNDRTSFVAHHSDMNGEFSAVGNAAQPIFPGPAYLAEPGPGRGGLARPIEVDEIIPNGGGTFKVLPAVPRINPDGREPPKMSLLLPSDGRITVSSPVHREENETDVSDSCDDEPNYNYSYPAETEVDGEPAQCEIDHVTQSCYWRSSTNIQKKFEDLVFHIHYHNVVKMNEIFEKESEKNQALLLIKKDNSDGLPCLLKAVKRQSVKCIISLLERFQKLSRTFEEYQIERLEALRSTKRRNIFHIGAEMARDGDILNAIDSCHLRSEIADEEDNNKTTPLIVACQHQNHEMVVRLVSDYKARILHIDNNWYSPMYFAAASQNEKTLEFLVQNATKMHMNIPQLFINNKLYKNEGTILQAIIEGRNPCAVSVCFGPGSDRLQLLLECLKLELQKNSKFIHQVCETPLVDLVKAAGDYQATLLEVPDEDGVTPLMRATEASQFDVVKTILSYESGRKTVSLARRNDNQTALLIACENGFADIAQLIVETCVVDLSHQDKNKRSVFHHASRHPEVLEVLIEVFSRREAYKKFKSFLATPDGNGYLPMHCAAVTGSHKSVSLLLENGVPYNTPSPRFGRAALHYAACTNLKTVKALVEFVKTNGSEEEKRKFIDASDSRSETSLYIAASLGKWKTVSYLLENGASMKCNHEKETPLHQAAASGSIETVNAFLAKHSALVNAENRVGETAAMFAAVSGHTEVLKLLLQHKAQLWGKGTEKRRTCLDWAVENKQQETAMAILDHSRWKETMEKSFFEADGLLAMMVKTMPNVAIRVLEQSRKTVGQHNERKEIYDFFALQTIGGRAPKTVTGGAPKTVTGEASKTRTGEAPKTVISMKAVEAMAELPRDECLRHKVVQKFLETKWRKRAKKWYWSCLVLYVIFLLSLTTYIGFVRTGSYSSNDLCVKFATGICMSFAIVNIIKELFQLLHKGLKYFYHFTTYLEVAMYICVFIFLPKDKKSNLQWQAGAIAIFLGWINFIGFLKRFPTLGIYIIMVKKILLTFIKVFVAVLFFIMAFAMTFFVLLHDDEGFDSIIQSSVTTFAMMVGEVDYRDTFLKKTGTNFALIMFFVVTFLVLMTILVMNLLTGLAVGDTGEILSRAMAEKRVQQAYLIVDMDRYLNKYPGMKARFVEPLTEQSKQDTGGCCRKITKCFGALKGKVCPSLEVVDPEEKTPSECQCDSMSARLDTIQVTLDAVQKSLRENKTSSLTRRQSAQLINGLRGRKSL